MVITVILVDYPDIKKTQKHYKTRKAKPCWRHVLWENHHLQMCGIAEKLKRAPEAPAVAIQVAVWKQ